MTTTAPYTTHKEKKESKYLSILYFMLTNIVIAFVYYFLTAGFVYPFTSGAEPSFALSASSILWVTFTLTIIVGIINFMPLALSKNMNRTGLRLTYALYYIFFLMFLLWALFTFTLHLPTAGVIILGVTTSLGIYLAYRYLTRSIVAGVIFTLYLLYLIYLFVQNLAYVLIV